MCILGMKSGGRGVESRQRWIVLLNKANLRDLIAATGLVMWNWIQIMDFSARVTLKFDGWPREIKSLLLSYIKLCASFQIHRWIQTGVTARKHSIRIEIGDICPVWRSELMDDLAKQKDIFPILHQALCIISNPSMTSNLSYSPETLTSGKNWWVFVPHDL